jgi:hypothetical protein
MMLRNLSISVALALAVMSLNACSQGPLTVRRVTLNQAISADDVAFIRPGKTDLSSVIEKLGAPNEVLPLKDGLLTRYYFADGKYFKANYAWGLRFLIPFFTPDIDLGGGGIGRDVLQVTYDDRWFVRDHAFSFHSNSSEFVVWPFKD